MSQDQTIRKHRNHNDMSPTNIILQAILSLYYFKIQKAGVKRRRQVHRTVTPDVVGSSPAAPAFCILHNVSCASRIMYLARRVSRARTLL